MDRTLGAIILAAGKGRRMQSKDVNKVALLLHNKPIISHIVHFMQKVQIGNIVVVVGFAKESVMNALKNEDVLFAEQKELRGTGDAVEAAFTVLPKNVTDVVVVYGDDAVIYNDKHLPIIKKLFDKHFSSGAKISFLTIDQDDPAGLGRIIRDKQNNILAIIEEKDATDEQKTIKEINPGCFVFRVDFLKAYLPKVEKSSVTGEYYLTSLIDIALQNNEKVETVHGGTIAWRGVNTKEELEEAEKLFKN